MQKPHQYLEFEFTWILSPEFKYKMAAPHTSAWQMVCKSRAVRGPVMQDGHHWPGEETLRSGVGTAQLCVRCENSAPARFSSPWSRSNEAAVPTAYGESLWSRERTPTSPLFDQRTMLFLCFWYELSLKQYQARGPFLGTDSGGSVTPASSSLSWVTKSLCHWWVLPLRETTWIFVFTVWGLPWWLRW